MNYRTPQIGETVQTGDEFYDSYNLEWTKTNKAGLYLHKGISTIYRRLI